MSNESEHPLGISLPENYSAFSIVLECARRHGVFSSVSQCIFCSISYFIDKGDSFVQYFKRVKEQLRQGRSLVRAASGAWAVNQELPIQRSLGQEVLVDGSEEGCSFTGSDDFEITERQLILQEAQKERIEALESEMRALKQILTKFVPFLSGNEALQCSLSLTDKAVPLQSDPVDPISVIKVNDASKSCYNDATDGDNNKSKSSTLHSNYQNLLEELKNRPPLRKTERTRQSRQCDSPITPHSLLKEKFAKIACPVTPDGSDLDNSGIWD
ncbi:hypothetical protein D917_01777 [Trichinella nativa]|uniref:Uncharacterized protein n=1 Tax=Trichinella nativa TaxID=6335 RepID=A0A1Y3EKY7_9BILA|nr:hypothetical protein D917_01777 [Trichinella nativa]